MYFKVHSMKMSKSQFYLHEEARYEGFSNVHVVFPGVEVGRGTLEVESVHDTRQLLPNVVG